MSDGWIEPQRWPVLAPEAVHVWTAHLPSLHARFSELTQFLSREEQERAARFRFDAHRERWRLARGILRVLLGRYLACSPRDLEFVSNAHGKPGLSAGPLQFNLSHSGEYAAFAFASAGAVGVDIEEVRGDVARHEAIAQRHFAAGERKQLETATPAARARIFFELWTCKEAFVKARGDGVFSGLERFEVCLDSSRIVSVEGRPASNWWLTRLPPITGYTGAAAVQATACSAQFWKCTETCLAANFGR